MISKDEFYSQAKQIKVSQQREDLKLFLPELSELPDHERLVYQAKYLGIPIGKFIFTYDGIVTLNGHEVYRFELVVKTLPFFARIFKTKDRYVSYMDTQKHVVIRHEEYIKGGKLLESAVDFDHVNRTATYSNQRDQLESMVKIPGKVHDILSGGYYLRMLPLELGDTADLNIFADGKIYQYKGLLASKAMVDLPHYKKLDAHSFKPSLYLDGEQIKKISAEIFFTTTSPTQTLRASLKTRFGSVHVVLVEGYKPS